ncbi:hypothetical protein F1737_08785 [Methanoplanus sp. FWC-SCC4]|uniref:Uncharacterized protein n=1 Tax=Methanochimaera problematica TaxID=2609417 RepID=A0AA97FEX3_9EURY|nr:hypothetical protein [Methanoplanus sp. FWC-SCC4]WOF16778.1 hypothetical protein F1737_08785 [Methanoplanus sp. FWC-SCC4]
MTIEFLSNITLPDPMMSAAVLLGISGALFVAAKSSKIRSAGFLCWIFGNLIWILEGAFTENIYMVVMFGFYWVTAVFGFFNSRTGLKISPDEWDCFGKGGAGN